MKKILLWDSRFPDARPTSLELDDAIASACVRAGVAAAADPADAGTLGSGEPVDPSNPTLVRIWSGALKRKAQVVLPQAVAAIIVSAGLGVIPVSAGSTPIPAPTTTPTPTPTPSPAATISGVMGQDSVLTAQTSGGTPTAYQWRKNVMGTYADIPGETGATLSAASASALRDAHGNNVRCVVNFGGTSVTTLPCQYLSAACSTRIYHCLLSNSANKQINFRRGLRMRGGGTQRAFTLPNWYWDRSGTKTDKQISSNSMTVTELWLEYPSGTYTAVPFGGSTSSVPTTAVDVTSDYIANIVPDGDWYWLTGHVEWSAAIVYGGSTISGATNNDTANGDRFEFGATVPARKGLEIASNASNLSYGPTAVWGVTREPTGFLAGDSRLWGANDTADASGDVGEVARSIGGTMGYINAGSYGDVVTGSSSYRARYAKNCSFAINQYGINNVIASSQSAATLVTAQQTYRTLYLANVPAWLTTIPPVSTSPVGLWAAIDGSDQTTHANNGERNAYNDNVRAGVAGYAGHFEVADVVETARNSGLWKGTGSARGYVQEGTHGTQFANLAIKNSGNISVGVLAR